MNGEINTINLKALIINFKQLKLELSKLRENSRDLKHKLYFGRSVIGAWLMKEINSKIKSLN
jgi:hypothetical protein